MINYDKATLQIWDYSKQNAGTLYSPKIKIAGQASDIKLTHQSNGWKELTFTMPMLVDGDHNPLIEKLVNEYHVHVKDGEEEDLFIITEPSITHNPASKTIKVQCNHVAGRLRTKKLYLALDDTNGVGTIEEIANTILSGTGWTLGRVDKFYEPDGITEKVRTLSSSGKEGAFALIGKLCDLFNAKPVYHGVTQVIDLVAFAPYTMNKDSAPTLHNPSDLIELNYSKSVSGITRNLDTRDMITRLYVEGEYGEDGYVGIEE